MLSKLLSDWMKQITLNITLHFKFHLWKSKNYNFLRTQLTIIIIWIKFCPNSNSWNFICCHKMLNLLCQKLREKMVWNLGIIICLFYFNLHLPYWFWFNNLFVVSAATLSTCLILFQTFLLLSHFIELCCFLMLMTNLLSSPNKLW